MLYLEVVVGRDGSKTYLLTNGCDKSILVGAQDAYNMLEGGQFEGRVYFNPNGELVVYIRIEEVMNK